MPTLDEALAASDSYKQNNTLVISNDLRTITVPPNFVLGVYNDKDTHRVYFSMPRYYGEFDLSTFKIRVNFRNANGDGDLYDVTDAAVNGDDSMGFSWLVGSNAYVADGEVTFAVCFINTAASSTTIDNEFNTTIAKVNVLEGYEVTDALTEEEKTDFLTAVRNAKTSEENAKNSETNTKLYENSAANSADAASKSATLAVESKNAAKASETNAATSEKNAAASASAASLSEKNAMSATPDGYSDIATLYNKLGIYIDEDGDLAQTEEAYNA